MAIGTPLLEEPSIAVAGRPRRFDSGAPMRGSKLRAAPTVRGTLFVVDASGSMAAHRRMAAAKGAIMSLLLDAYQRRDLVGLIAFRGAGAELVLAPTDSPDLASARLRALPSGGRTPLAAGLRLAHATIAARTSATRWLVVLVSDGRANVGASDAHAEALAAASALRATGTDSLVVDTESGPLQLGLAHAAPPTFSPPATCAWPTSTPPPSISARTITRLPRGLAAMTRPPKPARQGLTLIFTGRGKGKTTAAIGLTVHAAGNRMRVFFLQFIKGQWKTGERDVLRGIPGVDLEVTGRGFTIERLRNPRIPMDDHAAAAAHGWQVAQQIVREGDYDMVVLDEILGAINAGLVPLAEVVALVQAKPATLHLVLTGRGAPARAGRSTPTSSRRSSPSSTRSSGASKRSAASSSERALSWPASRRR